jgi:TorA maturation chaperone TorD
MPAQAPHPGLQMISLLFSYPDGQWFLTPQPAGAGAGAAALLEGMRGIEPVRLENEYVRLFINAMPELPCAPYGSVYLEGSVMGESTLKIADIYRKYGMATVEPADHIAVECEFLAWLHGQAAGDAGVRSDFEALLTHLRQWTGPFFDQVEQHDRLGCYRRSAAAARTILLQIA